MASQELALLKTWIQPTYLSPAVVQQIAKTFSQQHYIQLADFLQEKQAQYLTQRLRRCSWKHSYRPDMHSYHHASIGFLKDFSAFLHSAVFRAFMGTLIDKDVERIYPEVLLFQQGDYILLHDAVHQQGILFWLDFTQEWNFAAGGQTIVVTKDEPLIFAPQWNSLQVVYFQKQQQLFTKYVNSLAGKKRIIQVRGMVE